MIARRFPPPWCAHSIPGGFRVADANGCWLTYCYGDMEGRSSISGLMPAEMAGNVAAAIAMIPAQAQGEVVTLPLIPKGPWRLVEEIGLFHVTSVDGFSVATVYCGDPRAGNLSRDEARRIAVGVARLGGQPAVNAPGA